MGRPETLGSSVEAGSRGQKPPVWSEVLQTPLLGRKQTDRPPIGVDCDVVVIVSDTIVPTVLTYVQGAKVGDDLRRITMGLWRRACTRRVWPSHRVPPRSHHGRRLAQFRLRAGLFERPTSLGNPLSPDWIKVLGQVRPERQCLPSRALGLGRGAHSHLQAWKQQPQAQRHRRRDLFGAL